MSRRRAFAACLLLVCCSSGGIATAAMPDPAEPPIATFSIVAYDAEVQEWGVAVQSKFLAVGSVVPFAEAGVGAIATQAFGNTSYGPDGLALLRMNVPVEQVVQVLTGKDDYRDYRQLGIVDAHGNAAAWTGEKCQAWAGHITGDDFSVQGNILTGEEVAARMAAAFRNSAGRPLAERLLEALNGGQSAGGDSRGMQSAALLVVRHGGGYGGEDDKLVDLRVDDHPSPIHELERIYGLQERIFTGMAYARAAGEFHDAGNTAGAEILFTRAAVIARKYMETDSDANVLNAVAWEMTTRKVHLDTARNLTDAALKILPDAAHIWDTLAEIELAQGHLDAALTAFEKAVVLSGGDALYAEKLDALKKD